MKTLRKHWKGFNRHSIGRICPNQSKLGFRTTKCAKLIKFQMSPAGLLSSLPIPQLEWSNISMDSMEGLSKSNCKYAIFVVVDHLIK